MCEYVSKYARVCMSVCMHAYVYTGVGMYVSICLKLVTPTGFSFCHRRSLPCLLSHKPLHNQKPEEVRGALGQDGVPEVGGLCGEVE